MASFKTQAIPKAKPLKLSQPKAPKMPTLRLPTMKTGASPRPSTPHLAAVHGAAASAKPRAYSSAFAKAASTSSPTAAGVEPGRTGWRSQGRTTRPQQDSPLGFFGQ